MAIKYKTRKERRHRRHNRIRKKTSGTADCPRLCVNFSNKNMYAQVIDDDKGCTLMAVSSLEKSFSEQNGKVNVEGASLLGKTLGERMVEAGIKTLVFDRSGYKYHGKVKALADAVREAGLKF